ncbi:hypothetical protein [Ralstonia solanacearum]|nr:hypothetical protein [Ralstonia solanacearum]CBJ50905.1 hypothethical protein [Ralstonia solanacearum PSI07]
MYDRILVAVDGSVAESVVRQSALPVLLVRGAPGASDLSAAPHAASSVAA